jgi:radical SAM superfamily enzyme YgiQ (UPF0313 family)
MSRKIISKLQSLLAREQGAVVREWGHRRPVALVYPHEYAVGMSNLGFQTIYHLLNDHPDLACERVFLPDEPLLQEYQRRQTPLLSLESQRPLTDFAAVAFSLSFEPDYLSALKILELAHIPLLAADRGEHYPVIVAGGVATMLNPEPLAPFLDAFFLGEGDARAAEFFDLLTSHGHSDRQAALKILAQTIPGVYVPAAYHPDYHPDGTLSRFTAAPGFPAQVSPPHLTSLDAYPVHSRLLAPGSEFSRMFLLEINRGCGRGCRFCAAGFIYRPLRHRSLASLQDQLRAGLDTGAKIGLVGTALTDHPDLKDLLRQVTAAGKVGISSIRADCADAELFALLKQGDVKSVALAPEAGSPRLRQVINKNLSEADLEGAVLDLHAAGLTQLRLYFLLGLPTETQQDVDDIPRLTKRLQHAVTKAAAGRPHLAGITLSLNSFVPKPFTPFQWAPFAGVPELKDRIKRVKRELQGERRIRVHADLPKWAYYQALLARGDRRVSSILLSAHQLGGDWAKACRQSPLNPDFFVLRERPQNELFPWDFINHGINKTYLWQEYQNALAAKETPPCQPDTCTRCGVCPHGE